MSNDDRYTLRRPEPGRPTDRRVDQRFLEVRPELNGLAPFDDVQDIDVLDEVERVISNVRADVAYADPALGAALTTALNDTLPEKVAAVDAAVDAIPGQVAAGLAPVPVALADIAQDRAATIAATEDARAVVDAVRGDALYLRGEVPGGLRLYSLDPDRIRANSVTLRAAGTAITTSAVRVRFTQ